MRDSVYEFGDQAGSTGRTMHVKATGRTVEKCQSLGVFDLGRDIRLALCMMLGAHHSDW